MKKVALVTGAKGGIGSSITQALVDAGFRVIAAHHPKSEQSAKAHRPVW